MRQFGSVRFGSQWFVAAVRGLDEMGKGWTGWKWWEGSWLMD